MPPKCVPKNACDSFRCCTSSRTSGVSGAKATFRRRRYSMLPSASSPSIVVRLYKFLNSGDCSRSHVAAYPSATYSSNPGSGNGAPPLSNTATC